jgi:putative transposase
MDSVNFGHAAGQVVFDLTWYTKYRYKMLKRVDFFKACEASVRLAAERHRMEILELAVMPEHVHCLVRCSAATSAAQAAQLLKGSSAHDLFELEPKFRLRLRRGHFWSAGYHVNTVGEADIETARDYIRQPHNDPRQQKLSPN